MNAEMKPYENLKGEISIRRSFLYCENSVRQNFLRVNFLTAKFLKVKFPTAKFPTCEISYLVTIYGYFH